ncbi:hypothetical protein GCM10010918_48440 [Paenibacillus radicis (ex Gao et al. 2016)]|uniref:Uncharacterized protein n=1 Tax=Paenibacillus radicis (ex Gao et al. 2016) TaxID=1737354 RepID=A0A917HNX1_9BACL|nr:hypothetical protein GCM10010918_48440 [Paenibacillus radicis (ex Gao et al. 2016)]
MWWGTYSEAGSLNNEAKFYNVGLRRGCCSIAKQVRKTTKLNSLIRRFYCGFERTAKRISLTVNLGSWTTKMASLIEVKHAA